METSETNVIKIENIVASGSIATAIDLEYISNNITDCGTRHKEIPWCGISYAKPKFRRTHFESGRIVITMVFAGMKIWQ